MFGRLWRSITRRFSAGAEVSYSRINAYQTCPLKYKLMYVDGLRVPPNPFISLGISVHRTLEDFHRKKGESLEELFESYDTFWVNEGFQTPQQAHEFYEKGRRMLENYHRDSAQRASEILHLEKEFSLRLGKNRLHGIIDRIDCHPDGTYELIDYKTHAEIWKQDRVDTDLQLTLYALACEKALGFKPGLLSFYFLAHGRKMSTQRTPAQLEAAARTVADVAGRIEAREFGPNTAHCPRCDFRKMCRKGK